MINDFVDTVILHSDRSAQRCALEFKHGKFIIKPRSSADYEIIAKTLSDYVIDPLWIKNYNLLTIHQPRRVTRLFCNGGRWINVGTTVYVIPIGRAKLEMLREYKTVLNANYDIYNNTVCLNENEAIRDIKSQMNIFQWIMAYFK